MSKLVIACILVLVCFLQMAEAQHPLTNEFLRQQDRRSCAEKGGQWSYGYCYLENSKPNQMGKNPPFGEIIVKNACPHEIRFLVGYADYRSKIKIANWHSLPGFLNKQGAKLLADLLNGSVFPSQRVYEDGKIAVHNNKYAPLIYVETTDGSNLVLKGQEIRKFKGQEIEFISADDTGALSIDPSGNNIIKIVCH